MDGGHHLADGGQRIGRTARNAAETVEELEQRRREGGEAARLTEVPVLTCGLPAVDRGPGIRRQRRRQRPWRIDLHLRSRGDGDVQVTSRDVDVVHPVAEDIAAPAHIGRVVATVGLEGAARRE